MKNKTGLARELRKNQTDAERKLWVYLRNRQFCGLKFRRQYPVGKFIADFCCLEEKLVIEIDGGQHSECAKDLERSRAISKEGFRILRFWNHDVLQNTEGVLLAIQQYLMTPSPQSSPLRERK